MAALLAAPSIFVAGEWIGHDHHSRPPRRAVHSALAGFLWPLLAVGVAQLAVIIAMRHILVAAAAPSNPVFDDADTTQMARLSRAGVQLGTPAT